MTNYPTMTICGYQVTNLLGLITHKIKSEEVFVYITKKSKEYKLLEEMFKLQSECRWETVEYYHDLSFTKSIIRRV